MSDRNIYGEVNSISDIRDINRSIRREMRGVNSREQVTELKKRSDYLCTLTRAPSWKEKFGPKTANRMLTVAKEENERSTRLANSSARKKDLGPANYDPWGEP
jgi:hypothetical protein